MNSARDLEFDRLLSGLCDGTLSGEEQSRLRERLEKSPADRRIYLEYVDLHAVLLGETAFTKSAETLGQLAVAPRAAKSRSTQLAWLSLGAGLAVALLLFVGLAQPWFRFGLDPAESQNVVANPVSWARVLDAVGEVEVLNEVGPVKFLHAGDVIDRGQTLRTGLDDSYLAVELADGTRLLLCPESQVRLSGDDAEHPGQRVVLSTGVLQANVPALPAERQLVVVTPQAEIQVRETQLVVSSPDARSTSIETESGEARVTRTADGQVADVPAGYFTVALENERLLPVRQIGQLPSQPHAQFALERAQTIAFRGRQLLLAASFRETASFELMDQTHLYLPTYTPTESMVVAAAADGSVLVRGDRSGRYEIYDALTGELLHAVETGIRSPLLAAIAPGGKLLAVAEQVRGKASSVQLWDVTTPTELPNLPVSGSIRCLAFSPDGRRLAVGSVRFEKVLENWLEIWDHSAERRIGQSPVPEQALRTLAFSPDASRVAGATTRGVVHVFDGQTGSWLAARGPADGWAHPIYSLAFSPDNALLAAGTSNGRVRLWETVANRELGVLTCGVRIISALAFSPDGEELAVGAVRGPVLLYRLMETMPATDPL